MLVVINIILYMLIQKRKEAFALSSGTVLGTAIDPNKFYFVGTRSVSNTKTPAQFGGTECSEFPGSVFKLQAAVNAVCVGENDDKHYTFGDKPLPGVMLMNQDFNIQSEQSKFCWDIGGADKKALGASVIQWDCYDGDVNQFRYDPATKAIKNVNSGLCLGVPIDQKGDDATLVQFTCNGMANQQFEYDPAFKRFKVLHSDKCIAIGGSDKMKKGERIIQFTCADAPPFKFTPKLFSQITPTSAAAPTASPAPSTGPATTAPKGV
jgi:hypothetical protein